jgi:H+/Cl- antiporter ClcA
MNHTIIILFLPIAGLVIVFLYHILHMDKDRGTNKVISTVNADDSEGIPFQMAPLIVIATVLTHLFGGSAGREGAALQLGGSLGHKIGQILHLDEDDMKIIVMAGMSAAFSALFGTPMAAAIFPIEMVCVGSFHYAALVPCVFAALIASNFAASMGINPEAFTITFVPDMTIITAGKVVILGLLCGVVSILFCSVMHMAANLYNKYFKNPYVKIVVGGLIIAALTFLLRTTDYNGAGIQVIDRAMEGEVVPYAFLLKILFTAITLGAGYKGGEIVPSFFIGSTFGCLIGQLFGISPSLCAALGLIGVFCGATNCPISSMFISFELFGFEGVAYFLIVVATSYMISGYSSLYHNQKIVYSKYKAVLNQNEK